MKEQSQNIDLLLRENKMQELQIKELEDKLKTNHNGFGAEINDLSKVVGSMEMEIKELKHQNFILESQNTSIEEIKKLLKKKWIVK